MTDPKWQQVKKVFDGALRQKPEDRAGFVEDACGNNKSLLREIESLLLSHDEADGFMESPAIAQIPGALPGGTKQLEAGTSLGHYEIIKQIGAGGMGEVYLAKDKKLDRQVAIKILNERFSRDESNLRRFVSEARAASALNHPNILTIYEIGESDDVHYIVSEFIKGNTVRETLKENTLELSAVLDISIQIANALCAAHEARLVHRDIKPENIMIRPDGFVKVLDFGLAKLVGQENKSILGLEHSTALQNHTAKGVIMGTVNYMSPEQAKGEKVDQRTDIFSLGVVIYEMIAGRTPFGGDSVSETLANLINSEPKPLARFSTNVPDELQRIISKMLRKSADVRYQTMKDALVDLKDLREHLSLEEKSERYASFESKNSTAVLRAVTGDANKQTGETQNTFSQTIRRHKALAKFALVALLIGVAGLAFYYFSYLRREAPTADGKKSIAVLPVKPINTANRDEIYEIGIADSLILKLGSMKGFVVRPLSATRQYTDIDQDSVAAGEEQQVDYVLASNYQLAGGKIRVTSQLINVKSGQIEETYSTEKDVANVFAMQDLIAGEVGDKLSARFGGTSGGAAAKRGTTNEEAYRLYLQGIYLNDQRTQSDSQKAVDAFEQAIQLDPNYARAWAGKAHAHRSFSNYGSRATNVHEQHRLSMYAIKKSLELDPNLSEAYSVLCENKMYYEYDFAGAETACKRAIALKPDSPQAHNIYARFLMGPGRRLDEAITEIKTAIDLDPAALYHQAIYRIVLTFARRYDEANQQLERLVAIHPTSAVGSFWYVGGVEMPGDNSESFERLMRFQTLANTDEQTKQLYKTAYQTSGWKGVLRERAKWLHEYKLAHAYFSACVHAQLGDKDKAFEYLEHSHQERELWMAYLQTDPRLDSLRGDPRFNELVARVESK
jgi:serine/threonine-protein kinase